MRSKEHLIDIVSSLGLREDGSTNGIEAIASPDG